MSYTTRTEINGALKNLIIERAGVGDDIVTLVEEKADSWNTGCDTCGWGADEDSLEVYVGDEKVYQLEDYTDNPVSRLLAWIDEKGNE